MNKFRYSSLEATVGFTTETDGRLPCGKTLKEAVDMVYAQEHKPVDFIINCSHADHFVPTLRYFFNFLSPRNDRYGNCLKIVSRAAKAAGEEWVNHLGGVRCNASRRSHAELDNSTKMDEGDPVEFGRLTTDIVREFPSVKIVGGCCGTVTQHMEETLKCVFEK